MNRLSSTWYRWIHRLCTWIYLDRVRLLHRERLPDPSTGPVIYASMHRNGAVDGFVLHSLFPEATFLVTRNLRRNPFLRLFFFGIEVLRAKDSSDRRKRLQFNAKAMDACQDLLASGGKLIVFPEGTSSLGPRLLALQGGSARILCRYLETCPHQAITVVPIGLHYECAWGFRSRVEVMVGEPVATSIPAGLSPRQAREYLMGSLQRSLEEVGANFDSAREQACCEALAYAATLGTRRSFAQSLTKFAAEFPAQLAQRWDRLENSASEQSLLRHQGVPLVPLRKPHLPLYGLWYGVMAPLVFGAALLNAVPLLFTGLITRRCADDRNVIALTRIVVGLPSALLWAAFVGVLCVLAGTPWFFLFYLVLSMAGLLAFYRFKKLSVVLHNGVAATPELYQQAIQLRHAIIQTLNHERCTTTSSPSS